MVSPGPNHMNVFGLGADHALHWKHKLKHYKLWSPWNANPSHRKWLYEPITVSHVRNEISVFLVAEDGALHQSNLDTVKLRDLGPWINLGGKLLGPPALAKRHEGIIHIFHIGQDHAIYHKVWDGDVYSPEDGFEKLDGEFTRSLTAVSTGRDDVSVFGIGVDNRLYRYQWQSSSGWGVKEQLPGEWALSPKAVSDRHRCIDVFGIDRTGHITHVFCRNGENWVLETVPVIFDSIDAISLTPERIDIFALSKKKTIFHRTFKSDRWLAWEDLQGIMHQPPTAASDNPDVLGVFCVGQGGIVFYKVINVTSGFWTEWYPLGGVITSRVG